MNDISGLQATLEQVYSQMLPLCSQLIGAAQGIAGFAALWYIGARVWRQIAAVEPIDFYPLLRPFALGIAIMLFPTVIAIINGVLQPVTAATSSMVQDSNAAITTLLQQKANAEKQTSTYQMFVGANGEGDRDKWYKYTHPDDPSDSNEGVIGSVGNDVKFAMAKASYNFKNSIKEWMSQVLEILYEAAALCINTIRTFYLIVLAILGPLVFGLSVFDGLQHILTGWIAKYINVFLWLPVANIFGSIIGKVQQNMLTLDIAQIQSSGDTFFNSTDTAYLIFLLIGIIGYFTVPSVAGYIINPGGGNGLLNKVSIVASSTVSTVSNTASSAGNAAGSRIADGAKNLANAPGQIMEGYRDGSTTRNNYQEEKLKGQTKS